MSLCVFWNSSRYTLSSLTFCSYKLFDFLVNFSISWSLIDIFSMDLAKSIGVLLDCPYIVTIVVEFVANVDASTVNVPSTGITTKEIAYTTLACCSFSLRSVSSLVSIFEIFLFYSMMILNRFSFFFSFSPYSLACQSSVEGSLSYFFNTAISAFLFLMISSATFVSLGSYLSLITKSSKDFIFVCLASEETLSKFNCA